ncbi:hypothetical protein DFP72DRAFT_898179 [Ephemerocybe angulata]|uniref:GST N-terminal domain-containing protein n=1 Tax=Ephemerocybe angulata TaxID=980116 RepID=A0A8H6M7I6_9AGAR|nr:hypothetical protein DFP72DRAFT_898179 [Tulosesus angulatus]
MITLFDIPSTLPVNAWSVNTWKTRFTLNYKGIPYKTEWVEYPDIAAVLQKDNIGPTDTKRDGTPYYSLPAILDVDDTTGEIKAALADSLPIAAYLEKAYPDTPRVLPEDEEGLEEQKTFARGFLREMLPVLTIMCKETLPVLNEASREHFSKARAMDLYGLYGVDRLEDVPYGEAERRALWEALEVDFGKLEEKVAKTDAEGVWFKGAKVTFADFQIGGCLIWIRTILGESSEEWARVSAWNGGRWGRFLEGLKEYETVV